MKKISICMFAAFLAGCSSPPELKEPEGEIYAVYALQHELNERPMTRSNSELPAREKKSTDNKATPAGVRK